MIERKCNCFVVTAGKPTPKSVLDTLKHFRPTVFFGVPTLYGQLLEYWDAFTRHAGTRVDAEHPFSSVRLCVSSGEALPAIVFQRWKERFGIEIVDGIGSTELLHIFISNVHFCCELLITIHFGEL